MNLDDDDDYEGDDHYDDNKDSSRYDNVEENNDDLEETTEQTWVKSDLSAVFVKLDSTRARRLEQGRTEIRLLHQQCEQQGMISICSADLLLA